ncbi:MAG: class I SAM-dependent methyltransferase [Gemmatimonadota bacterium]
MNALPADLAALDDRFVLTAVEVTVGGTAVLLEKPRNADDLISEADFAHDERLPYWADLWPASVVLADHVLRERALLGAVPDGPRPTALELGCGLGLVTLAAQRAGYVVTATDYYEDALRFAARNTLRHIGERPASRLVDWRVHPEDLGTVDLVLAADVLYERPYAAFVAEAIARARAPRGRALLSDQGRVALEDFLVEAAARDLVAQVVHRERRAVVPAAPDGSTPHHMITIFELRRR